MKKNKTISNTALDLQQPQAQQSDTQRGTDRFRPRVAVGNSWPDEIDFQKETGNRNEDRHFVLTLITTVVLLTLLCCIAWYAINAHDEPILQKILTVICAILLAGTGKAVHNLIGGWREMK